MDYPKSNRRPRVPSQVHEREPTPAPDIGSPGLTRIHAAPESTTTSGPPPRLRAQASNPQALGDRGTHRVDRVEFVREFTSDQHRETGVASNGDVALAFYDLFELALDAVGSYAVMESVFIEHKGPLLPQQPYTFRARITHVIDCGSCRRLRLHAEVLDSRGQQAASALARFVDRAHPFGTTTGLRS